MGSVRIFALSCFLFFFPRVFPQECSSIKLADTDVLETVEVYNNEYAIDDDRVSYEIAASAPSTSFDQVSDPVRILTSNQSACPSTCTVTLNRYTDTFQGNQTTILFFDNDHSFYLPSHYVKDNTTQFICVSSNGFCGATIPVYRYYKISNGGVFHAYSFDQEITYDGYNQEFLPICYVWPAASGTVASRPTCGTLNFDTPLSALSDLNIYDNHVDGIERDHYYTTLPPTDPTLVGYNQSGVLGKVLTSSKSTACSCLVKLIQQFDNQTGYFHRLDHKLIVTGQEQNRPYEEYTETGETIYCTKRLGDCGATLPLWKHFQFYDIDTVYTTDSSPLPMSYLYPQIPLCYIWAPTYSPNASNIPSVTPAQWPSSVTLSSIGTGTPGTTGTPAITPPTGSTPLLDGGGFTPMIGIIPTTGLSMSTASTGFTGIGGSTAPPNGLSASSSGTALPITPGTSPSTISSWSTMSPIYPVTTPSISVLGTTSTPSGNLQSTVSVWGTASPTTPGSTPSTISVWGTTNTQTGSTPSTVSVWGTATPTTPGTSISTISFWSTMSPIYPMTTGTGTPGTTASTISVWGTASATTPGTAASTMSPIYPVTTGTPPTGSTISVWGTAGTTPRSTPSTVSVWGTAEPTTHGLAASTISPIYPITTGTPPTGSTVSVWGTASPTTPGSTPSTISVWGTTPSSNSSTTAHHLSDGGAVTPGLILLPNATIKSLETDPPIATEANEASEAPLEEDVATHDPTVPETFTLSDFWYLTTTTTKSPINASPSESVASGQPTVGPASSSGTTHPPPAAAESSATPAGTVPTVPMITGPLFGSLFNQNQPSATVSPLLPSATMAPPASASLAPASGSSVPLSSEPSGASSLPIAATTLHPNPSESVTGSALPVLTTPSPQHIAQAPTYSIVGGPLNSFTNPPIIEALISSSNPSTTAPPAQGQTPSSLQTSTSTPTIPATQEGSSQPVKRDAFSTTTTEAPGILWKAGDWISNTWHSVFGGGDQMPSNISSTSMRPLSTDNLTTTTVRPMGGLVGSLINSTGNFFNDTKQFIGNTISGSGDSNSSSPVSNFFNATGNIIGQALSSNSTGGSFINNTKNWIDDKWDSTGEFLSNAWDSLGSGNDTTGSFLNSTKTWVGGAVNSTGQFISGAWNETKEHSGSFLNTSKTWVGEQLNGTAIGTFLNTTGSAIAGNVTSAIGGLVGGAKDVIGSAGEAINGLVGGSNETVSNGSFVPAAPLSNAVGSVASAILSPVNTTTADPTKIEWNGGRVDGPLTG